MRFQKPSAVTGATGFIGRRLCQRLESPRILTRRPEAVPSAFSGYACFRWDPASEAPPPAALDGCRTVFHLAGEPVAEGRWTASKKVRIRDSRILGTRNLVAGLASMDAPPEVLVAASAVGYYGSRGDEVITEDSAGTEGFLGEVCEAWEAEAMAAEEFGIRVVTIRIGLVLGRGGGALAKMLPLFRMGLGGRLGNGKQWMPWIHVDDLADLFLHACKHPELQGAVNGTAPNPVTNRDFTRAVSRAVSRPALFPAPGVALRLGLGEFASVLLASQRVQPVRALESGFEFRFDTVDAALAEACGNE